MFCAIHDIPVPFLEPRTGNQPDMFNLKVSVEKARFFSTRSFRSPPLYLILHSPRLEPARRASEWLAQQLRLRLG